MTPARKAEAERVELTYYWALNRLANSMALDAKDLWAASVPPTSEGAARATRAFTAQLVSLMFTYRVQAQRLAIAYYRLNRALLTDHTIALGGESDGDETSIESLRQDFEAILDEIEGVAEGDEQFVSGDGEADFTPTTPPALTVVDEDAPIVIEALDADIDAILDAADEQAETEIRKLAESLGIKNLQKKLEKAERKKNAEAAKAKAYEDASNRQAAAAMRIMMNAARGLVYDLAQTDLRIEGWVRYSQTGTPCGFCAMLISREVYYRTRKSAGGSGDPDEGNRYHDNCKCTVIPIFDVELYENSKLFNQNRYYSALWKARIQGKFGGNAALNAWRKLIREQNAGKSETSSQTSTAA